MCVYFQQKTKQFIISILRFMVNISMMKLHSNVVWTTTTRKRSTVSTVSLITCCIASSSLVWSSRFIPSRHLCACTVDCRHCFDCFFHSLYHSLYDCRESSIAIIFTVVCTTVPAIKKKSVPPLIGEFDIALPRRHRLHHDCCSSVVLKKHVRLLGDGRSADSAQRGVRREQ